MIKIGRTSVLTLGVLVAALAVTAVRAEDIDKIAHLSGPDRQSILEEGARKEGSVILSTSLIVDQAARPLEEAFEAKYPYIDLQFSRNDSQQIIQQVFAQARAGVSEADVVVASTSAALAKAGLLQSFDSPVLAEYPAEFIQKDHLWASIRFTYTGIGYNTSRISEAEAPKTWEDLLDPKWKGRMVWTDSQETGGPLVINYLIKLWGKEKAEAYFDKLAKQDVAALTGSVRAALDQVIAGEHDILLSAALHHVIISHEKGAPVWFVSPNPTLARPDHIQLLKTAPHPHAAMLFIDFLLSKAGQHFLADANYIPAHPDVAPPEAQRPTVPALNGRDMLLVTPEDSQQMQADTMEIFKKTSR